MPKISLVVCLYKERDLLERLLQHAEGCYDDLVVVHDGPEDEPSANISLKDIYVPSHRWPEMAVDYSIPEEAAKAAHFWSEKTGIPEPGSVHDLVAKYGGRFFEGPRCWQQEPHWPFAWSQAKHDWILRLDADEYPSIQLCEWLKEFRSKSNVEIGSALFRCIWPLWNGRHSIDKSWPDGRVFLFSKKEIKFIGLAEFSPVTPKSGCSLPLVLNHTPKRKSYGYRNILLRRQAYKWRRVISLSILESPLDLCRWNWVSHEWPQPFKEMREHPLKYSARCVFLSPRFCLKALLKNRMWSVIYSFLGSHWNHALICIDFLTLKSSKNPVVKKLSS